MPTPHNLPAALAPWAPALAALDVELAIALGPLVRQLDQLVVRHDAGVGSHGPLDGYAGLARRGTPERMSISEWALATDAPAEFLRRAVAGELLYLDPAYQQDRARGRVAALVDTGPDQLGAGRLVQLAALIVLHRRASASGTELVVGVLGDEPGAWREGELARLLPGWLRSRRTTEPSPGQVSQWTDTMDHADEAWLLTGPRLAAQLPGRRRVLASTECMWNPSGATAVEVLLDGVRVELVLPRRDLAVRALRGAAFRGADPLVADMPGQARLGPPGFPSGEPRLHARGRDGTELVVATVPGPGRPAGRPRRHRFAGPVVAATFACRRLVALVLDGDHVRAQVVGKRLAHLDQVRAPLGAFDTTRDALLGTLDQPPGPLYFASGDLLWSVAGSWWRVRPDEDPWAEPLVAIGPGQHPDQPRFARLAGERIWVTAARSTEPVPRDAQVVLGAGTSLAWSVDGTIWTLLPGSATVTVDPGSKVLGIVDTGEGSGLVTVSPGGLLVRLHAPDSRRTLTRWSGGAAVPALHPVRPWLAVLQDDGRIEVGDLVTNTLLLTIRDDQ